MINIDMGMKVAGRVAFQKYKIDPSTGERVNTSEELEVDNIITQAGIDSISMPTLTPRLGAHYLALGEGTQLEELSVTKMANIKIVSSVNSNPRVSTAYPKEADKLTVPRLRTLVSTRQFSPTGEERIYTEVAFISKNSTTSYTCYTYAVLKEWNDVTSSYDPVSVTVAADEYLEITYKYQISLMPYLPTDIPVVGEGIPSGTRAALYNKKRDTYYSPSMSYLYYQTQGEVTSSGWEENYDKLHFPGNDVNLPKNFQNHDPFSYRSSYNSFYGSAGHGSISKKPTRSPTISSTSTEDQGILEYGPGTLTTEDRYLVGASWRQFRAVVMFSKGIKITKDDKVDLTISINYTFANTTWTDPATYD